MKLPDFLILGSPRCGTTWLAKALGSHPEVFMPSRKELHFFDREYESGIASYSAHFPDRDRAVVASARPRLPTSLARALPSEYTSICRM